MFGPSIYLLSSVFVELDRVSESRSALNIYIFQLRTCENLPYIGSILRELEINDHPIFDIMAILTPL
jgi:hypothetical protein